MGSTKAAITIGGSLDADGLHDLAEVLSSQAIGFDWDDPVSDDAAVVAGELAQRTGEPLLVMDSLSGTTASAPLFEACRRLGLTFVAALDPYEDLNAAAIYWTPEMDVPRTVPTDEEGRPVVDVARIEAALSDPDPVQAVRSMLAPLRLPTVPSFETPRK